MISHDQQELPILCEHLSLLQWLLTYILLTIGCTSTQHCQSRVYDNNMHGNAMVAEL